MSFRPCATGCGHYLVPGDGHYNCLTCLGLAHAEVALMYGTCSHCGNMTISVLRSRLQYLEETVETCPESDPEMLLCYPGPPRASDSSGTLHRVLSTRGWMIGFLRWPVLVLSAPACTVSGSLASAPQPISLAHPHHQTRQCDSVCPASGKFRGIHFTSV